MLQLNSHTTLRVDLKIYLSGRYRACSLGCLPRGLLLANSNRKLSDRRHLELTVYMWAYGRNRLNENKKPRVSFMLSNLLVNKYLTL